MKSDLFMIGLFWLGGLFMGIYLTMSSYDQEDKLRRDKQINKCLDHTRKWQTNNEGNKFFKEEFDRCMLVWSK